MGTGHAESFVALSECAQHLCSLLDFETLLAEVFQLFVLGRDGRCVDDKTRLRLAAGLGNGLDIFFIV